MLWYVSCSVSGNMWPRQPLNLSRSKVHSPLGSLFIGLFLNRNFDSTFIFLKILTEGYALKQNKKVHHRCFRQQVNASSFFYMFSYNGRTSCRRLTDAYLSELFCNICSFIGLSCCQHLLTAHLWRSGIYISHLADERGLCCMTLDRVLISYLIFFFFN